VRSPRSASVALWILFASAFSIGAIAAAAPHTFYADFPFFAHWVEMLPPYNQHLVTDVGGLYLGFAVIFAWAALKPDRILVRAASTAWLLTATIHLAFHVTHLDGFSTADAVGQLASLAFLLLPPAVAIWAVGAGGGELTRV
jgi:hypothetical protein